MVANDPSRQPPSDAAWRSLRALIRGDRSPPGGAAPPDIAQAARLGGVACLVAELDEAIGGLLQRDITRAVRLDISLNHAIQRAAEAFDRADIEPVALLKGSATAHMVYSQPLHRQRRDVDLLVSDADFARVIDALSSDGWEPHGHAAWWRDDPGRAHEATLSIDVHGVRVECDVHRRLVVWDCFDVDHRGILERSRPATGVPLPLCSPDDALLHACLHAATTGFIVPLRSWIDIARLAAHREVDLDRVVARSRRWGAGRALWAGLRVATRWFDAPVEDALLKLIEPPRLEATALRSLLAGHGQFPLAVIGLGARPLRTAAKALALGNWAARRNIVVQFMSSKLGIRSGIEGAKLK